MCQPATDVATSDATQHLVGQLDLAEDGST
jgi:hypothetical protein